MKTRCFLQQESISETLLDYCCGTLEGQRRPEVDEHLTECAACRRFVEEQKALWCSLDAWQDITIPADFDDRLLQRIAEEERKSSGRRSLRRVLDRLSIWDWKPVAGLAACALLLVLFLNRTPQPQPQPATAPPQSAQAPVDLDAVESALEDLDLLTPVSHSARSGAF